MKKMLFAALLLGLSTAAQAHEVWIERDGDGPARIYLGEPAEPMPAGGDPEFAKLKAPKLLKAPNARLERKAGYLEAALPAGDVRAWDDTVFAPWGEPGKQESVVYYARAGRTETRADFRSSSFLPRRAPTASAWCGTASRSPGPKSR